MADAQDYLSQLRALMPPGEAWTAPEGSDLANLLDGLAQELARVDAAAADLLEEADPRTADRLLGDWEAAAGLPDDCTGSAGDRPARRRVLTQRLAGVGGQTPAFFEALAANLGFTASVREYPRFRCGSGAGDACAGPEWAHVWSLRVSAESAEVERGVLECVMGRARPAHTTVLYFYPE